MSVGIAAENAITTGRETWANIQTEGNGDIHAAGFARRISVNVGETMQFSVDGNSTVIDIYRVGWYGGSGFRKVATIANTPAAQPEATVIPGSNGATTCTAWSVTASWAVPSDATSGLYLAMVRSVAPYAPNAFYISFIVRDDFATADITYKTSDSTWGAAYNCFGTKSDQNGKNLYGVGRGVGNIMERSFAVSYHRPVITRESVMQTFWMACEMPMIRFLERQGYTMKYVSCVDLDVQGASLLAGKTDVFLSSGHDEYWSAPMRNAVEMYRDQSAGRSIFFSANEVFWKSRFQYAGDEVIMWCYKDTMPGPDGFTRASGTPLDPVEWTGTWKDTRWPDRKPEWLLTGTDFRMNMMDPAHSALVISNPYGAHKVWGGSSLVDSNVTFVQAVGFEADLMRPTQPVGSAVVLAAYTRNINGSYADDNGEDYGGNGDLTWGIIAQRYAGGGVTVGFGTCQWSWQLDNLHDRGSQSAANLTAQQFVVNLLRDLGAEPATLMSGVTLRAVNSLDEYGLEPQTDWFDYNGNPLIPYLMRTGGELVQLS